MKICIFFIICSFVMNFQFALGGNTYLKGLLFRSHEVNKDERTSLDLTPDKGLSLKDGFTLEFDMKLSVARHTYGYIFRIISDDLECLDLTSDMGRNKISIILNKTEGIVESYEFNYTPSEIKDRWVHISVQIEKEQISFYLDDNHIGTLHTSFNNFFIRKIYFGANRHERYYTTDTPPMTIRDIILKNKKGKTLRYWEMSRHGAGVVYDEIKHHKATVLNGIWEIDKHSHWVKKQEFAIRNNYAQIATDSVNGRVFVAVLDSLYILSVKDAGIKRIGTQGGSPFMGASSYLLYDYGANRLVSYNNGQNNLIFYDFKENEWSFSPKETGLFIQHHNRFIDEETRTLVVFGGYGIYRYNSRLITHPLEDDTWEVHDFKEEIMPRYLASMAYLGEGRALLFGGYGSISGLQEASPHNIYDLVEIDSRNNTSEKLGELSGFREHYAFGNTMVVDREQDKLYTLAYKSDLYRSWIHLLEIDKNSLEHRFVGDTIPYNFQDTESFCDIFLSDDSSLNAVILQKRDGLSNISIYTLLYPPLSEKDILQTEGKGRIAWLKIIVGLMIFILFVLTSLYFYKKKLHTRNEKENPKEEDVPAPTEEVVKEKAEIPEEQLQPGPLSKKSTISLLGGFQVFDKNGKDITGQFTPVIRQIFFYCLLEYQAKGKGVTSARLEEFLWYDMDKTKAVNNRNVNIRKLRVLLKEIGDVSLQKTNSYWQVEFGKGVYCDYTTLVPLLQVVENNEEVDKEIIEKIIEIASGGMLLPHYNAEWVDRYKSHYSALVIKVILKITRKEDIRNDLPLMIRLADVVLNHDSIDEEFIQIKCHSLYLLGQKGLSKRCYDKFCIDYKDILGEVPKITYEAIINTSTEQ